MTRTSTRTILGFSILFFYALIAWWLSKQVYSVELPFGIPGKVLEFPLWAALVGLVANFLHKKIGIYEYIKPGIRTELFLKVGLILLGAKISLTQLVTSASGAVIQALIMIVSVFFFTWWLGGKLGLDDKLRAVMAMALSVCGVSAAIAAAGSVMAKKEQVTYVTALVIFVALPMMVIMPLIAMELNMPDEVAGAWFGGNIDTSAAVVGAGTIYSDLAQETATIVKSTQNALIGVVAFALAFFFVAKEGGESGQRPSIKLIWDRFPKFVIGFVLASVLFTFGLIDGGKGTAIYNLKNWAFTLAFVGMGMEISFKEFKAMGTKPVIVFLTATLFNTVLAMGVAWMLFG